MFQFDDDLQMYTTVIDGVTVAYDEMPDSDEEARHFAKLYAEKLDEIAAFIISESIEDCYGPQTVESVKANLGMPEIEPEQCMINYLEHTFDEEHIIGIEYDGDMEKFLYMSLDG